MNRKVKKIMSLITSLLVFFGLVIYALICFYIGYNGWVWLKSTSLFPYKKIYIAIIAFFSLSIFLGRLFPLPFFEWISGYWMAIIGYSLILLPLVNLLVYLFKKKGIFWLGLVVMSFFLFITIFGTYNAWTPVVRTFNIEVEKESNEPSLKIFMVSDLHLGSIVGKEHLRRLVELTEQEKPDIILIPGDIINDDIGPFIEQNMGEVLKEINAPMGVYAVLGNHDYYGGDMDAILDRMNSLGVHVLMDEAVNIDNEFYIVGRKDLTDKNRKVAKDIISGLNLKKPIIMMDHQPVEFDEVRNEGIDILLSGHTHRGQLAPANIVTNWLYENDWGYLKKETLHSFVSSGFGTWGPPLRIGSQSEVMVINVEFKSPVKNQ